MKRYLMFLLSLVVGCALPVAPAGGGLNPQPELPAVGASEPSVPSTAVVVAPAPVVLPALRVWVSPGVAELEGVRAGVEGWREATRGVRDWTFTDSQDDADLAIYEIGPYGNTCGIGGAPPSALACVQGVGGLWRNESGEPMSLFLINSTRDDAGRAKPGYQANPKLVTMHEIGHLLGLVHGAGALMNPYAGDMLGANWECPDAESVATLEEKLDLDGLMACAVPVE